MSRTTYDLTAVNSKSNPVLTRIWDGVKRVTESEVSPYRVPERAFDELADTFYVRSAADLLPELARDEPESFRALVTFAGSQGCLNAAAAAEFVATASCFVPLNKADVAALARAAGYPAAVRSMASLDDLDLVGGFGGRLTAQMKTPAGYEFWLHRNAAGEDVRLIVAPPRGLLRALAPSRYGGKAPRFGLAA